MRRRVALPLLLVITLSSCGGSRESADRAANEAILDELPRYPEAVEVGRVTTPYTLGDSGRPDGYGTRVTHQVPAGTLPDDIISFYETRLTGWDNLGRENVNCSDGSGNDSPCDIITIRFRRGAAMVAINTDNLATPASSFDISVEATRCERDPDDAFCHR